MLLVDGCDVDTSLIALLVLVEIDDCDDLLLAEVKDVGLTGNVERSGLCWHIAKNLEEQLRTVCCLVNKCLIRGLVDDGTQRHSLSGIVGCN